MGYAPKSDARGNRRLVLAPFEKRLPARRPSIHPGDAVFHAWYAPGGVGSGPRIARRLHVRISWRFERFMEENDVRSVLDYGCGDWQSSKLIDWGARSYLGVDIGTEPRRSPAS